MSLSINTNIASLQAQNNLSQVNKALEQNQERLSSGLRINSAADDAAGLAISDRMTAQVKGMNQASRNASDGISMAQTAEGGMQEITNILQRMRQLSVQSANETNTQSDRQSLNQEFQELSSELDRIAQSTSFNGKALLDGSRGEAQFQVGPNTGSENIISIDMSKSMRSEDIGKRYEGDLNLTNVSASNVGSAASATTLSDGELNLTTADGSAALNLSSYADSNTDNASEGTKGRFETSAYSIAKSINSNENINVNAEAKNEQTSVNATLSSVATATASGTGGITTATATATYSLSINGVAITAGYTTTATATNTSTSADDTITASATVSLTSADREHIVDAINNKSDETDVTAKTVTTDSGETEIELNSLKGGNMAVDETIDADSGGDNTTTAFFQGDATDTVDSFRGNVEVRAESVITADDTGADQEFTNISANGTVMFGSQNDGLASMDVSSVTSAQNAIEKIDAAINDVDSFRATMGAAQNRMESTIANLENSVQNLTEARSRIKDADIAKEAAEQTMNNVRRQASASVLTQANQSPQLALQLLGG